MIREDIVPDASILISPRSVVIDVMEKAWTISRNIGELWKNYN